MPISNYPQGFAHGITIRGLPLQVAHPGKVFWVNNSGVLPTGGIGASDGNDGTYLRPFSTLDYAIGKCTASRGDIIMIMPGHIEAVTATSIAMDVAGVAIIGLGEGDLRPKFTFGVTTSTISISAANCSLKNLVLVSTVDSVVAGITLAAGADGLTLDIETRDTSAAIEFVSALVTVSTADNLVAKMRHRGFVAGNAMTRYIDLVGCRDAVIDLDFFGIASTSVVDMRTTACNNIQVTGRFYNETGALSYNVTNNTTSTWSVEGFDAKAARQFAGSDDQAVRYLDNPLITDDTNNAIGVDDADNAFASTNVTANRDGSVLERLEHILDVILDDETTNPLGVNDADNAFVSSSVVANVDGSILERLEALMDPLGGYDPILGYRVTKTGNLADGSGTDNLFTVTGRCLITHLSGEVIVQLATTNDIKISNSTDSTDLCAATTIVNDVVGTMYHLDGVKAAVLNSGIAPVVGSTSLANGGYQPIIVGATQNAKTLAMVSNAAGTGTIDWVLYYKPLVASATVVAAA